MGTQSMYPNGTGTREPWSKITDGRFGVLAKRVAAMGLLLLLATFGLVACSAGEASGEVEPLPTLSTVEVFEFGNPDNLTGASWLTRGSDFLEMGISTTGLKPDAYTVWWVIFNEPTNCNADGCNENDIFIDGSPANGPNKESRAAARISALWATGFIVGEGGVANVSARYQKGFPPGQVIYGPGVEDINKAEIHLVIRTHGEPLPGEVGTQITNVNGGCNPKCHPVQAAVYKPVS